MTKYFIKLNLKKRIIDYAEIPKSIFTFDKKWSKYKIIEAKNEKELFEKLLV